MRQPLYSLADLNEFNNKKSLDLILKLQKLCAKKGAKQAKISQFILY